MVIVIQMIIVFFFQHCQLHINAHATNLVLTVMVERIILISFAPNISDFISFIYFTEKASSKGLQSGEYGARVCTTTCKSCSTSLTSLTWWVDGTIVHDHYTLFIDTIVRLQLWK